MARTLMEYAAWLESRDLIWPMVPDIEPVKASPAIRPLRSIRVVLWNLYGTLVRIADGELLVMHPQRLRMQIALEKTIQEFNMWNSMSRKPGAPWEYMFQQYSRLVEDRGMSSTGRKGDVPATDLAEIWEKLVSRLLRNEYTYDVDSYGDLDEFAEKVAYFFHANLQAVTAAPDSVRVLNRIANSSVRQGLLADAQPFSLVQSLRAFSSQGKLLNPLETFDNDLMTLSCREGVCKPSPTLYRSVVRRLAERKIQPHEVLYVSTSLREDLSLARKLGLRTALLANDHLSLRLNPPDLKDDALKPDRLLTQLSQVLELLGLESTESG